jgi:exopolysaccharide biosynthesis WecB/TagA/CpsF family protein
MEPIRLLGLDYDDLSVPAAAALIAQRPADAPFRYVVTPNADHLVRLARAGNLRPLYTRAWLRLLDSRVVSGAARLLGLATPRACPGSDLTAALVASLRPHDRVTVIGASRRAVLRLGVRQAAQHIPPIGFERDQAAFQAAVDFVLAHPARYVFFAVGSPRQEMLAWAVAHTGQATGTGLCIGNSLAFLSGEARRAPRWLQLLGLEWSYRLATEPRRLARRYLLDSPPVLSLLLRARLRQGRAGLARQARSAPDGASAGVSKGGGVAASGRRT